MASKQIRDLTCDSCGVDYTGVLCHAGAYGDCEQCGGPLRWLPNWNGANGGLYGSPQYSDASGLEHSSQHEKELHMAKHGYIAAGDPIGGARKDHSLKHSAISAPGLGSRQSTGERSR